MLAMRMIKVVHCSHEGVLEHPEPPFKSPLYCTGYETDEEGNSYFHTQFLGTVLSKGSNVQWTSIVNSGIGEWRALLHTKVREWWWWWRSSKWSSFKPSAQDTMMNECLHHAPAFHYPEPCPDLGEGFLAPLRATRS